MKLTFLALLPAVVAFTSHLAVASLEGCENLFIQENLLNAPTVLNSSPDEPFGTNVHLCYRTQANNFFAMEYWPERHAARWVAYRIDGSAFGDGGCSSYTRKNGNCYINEEVWTEPFTCERGHDPFHTDHLLGNGLNDRAFTNSGHDRGHMAPRQALSWDVCGSYQTFSMANMSAQAAALNQGLWADLESQVLTWGVEHGPIFVVTGLFYGAFPHESFSVYQDGTLSRDEIYRPGITLEQAAKRIAANASDYPTGHILSPRRNANPDRLNDDMRSLPMPTGYFKVIYRPQVEQEPARAIGFLVPHSFERLEMLANAYEGLESKDTLWAFSSRIDLIEAVSGVRFPGIPDELKRVWRDRWFFDRKGHRQLRAEDCGLGTPSGVLVGATKDARLTQCLPIPTQ